MTHPASNDADAMTLALLPLLFIAPTASAGVSVAVVSAVLVAPAFGMAALVRGGLAPAWHLPTAVLIAITLTVCAMFALDAVWPAFSQELGQTSPLLAAPCVFIAWRALQSRESSSARSLLPHVARVLWLPTLAGVTRELLGAGTLFHDATGWFGARAAVLSAALSDNPRGVNWLLDPPGALLIAGLVLLGERAWRHPTRSEP